MDKLKEKLAHKWCRLNDRNSWYNKRWKKDEIFGAMKIIESFIDRQILLGKWHKYIYDEKKKEMTLREAIRNVLADWIISHCHKTCGREINVEKETALMEADEILAIMGD